MTMGRARKVPAPAFCRLPTCRAGNGPGLTALGFRWVRLEVLMEKKVSEDGWDPLGVTLVGYSVKIPVSGLGGGYDSGVEGHRGP